MLLWTSEVPVLLQAVQRTHRAKSFQDSNTRKVDIWQVGRQAVGETEGTREQLEEGGPREGQDKSPLFADCPQVPGSLQTSSSCYK